MLSLKLSFKSENMFTRGIVDSGSTGTFMPFNIVQLIGLLDGDNTSYPQNQEAYLVHLKVMKLYSHQ